MKSKEAIAEMFGGSFFFALVTCGKGLFFMEALPRDLSGGLAALAIPEPVQTAYSAGRHAGRLQVQSQLLSKNGRLIAAREELRAAVEQLFRM